MITYNSVFIYQKENNIHVSDLMSYFLQTFTGNYDSSLKLDFLDQVRRPSKIAKIMIAFSGFWAGAKYEEKNLEESSYILVVRQCDSLVTTTTMPHFVFATH